MTLTEYTRRLRNGRSPGSGTALPQPRIWVRAAEGTVPVVDGLDARRPDLSVQDVATLLGPARGGTPA